MRRPRALFLGGPIARDDTTLPLGADPFSSLLPGALAEGDWVRLLTPDADGTEEYAQLDAAPTASEITLVDGVVFAANEPVLVSWEYCWPSLYRPAESLHEPLTVATKGRHWQLSLTLHVDLYSLFAPQLSNGDVFDVLGSAGLSLDDVVDMPGNPLDQGGAERVRRHGADVGICLDGDADRIILIDETGQVADGDQLMGLMAARWAEEGRLKGGALVATVMSNLGLERLLESKGLHLERTKVGDRYVVERMREGGFNLGGEQSGHIVMTDYATTGDGLMAGLQFLREMVHTGRKASDLTQCFEPVPQLLKNVRFGDGAPPLEAPRVKDAIAEAEARLVGKGRLLIRKSGTEPLIRVMAECEDDGLLHDVVNGIVAEVEAVS